MTVRQLIITNTLRTKNLILHGHIGPPRAFVSEACKAVYLENPKVASTSVKQVIYPDVPYDELGQDAFHVALEHHAVYRLPSRYKDYAVFFIARNPFSRLVSAFRDKVEGRTPSQWGVYNTRFFHAVFRYVGKMEFGSDPISFDQFAMAVSRIPDQLADRHIASQSRWARSMIAPEKVQILHLETLNEDWAALQARTDLPALPQLNPTDSRRWLQYYTDSRVIDAVAKRYQTDLALFGYDVPEPFGG